MANQFQGTRAGNINIGQLVVRFIVGVVVLGITAALTPGFSINGIWSLLIGALVLSVLDYAALRLFKVDASPFGRGIIGFVMAAVIIYLTQYFVAGYTVSMIGAVIAALVYGIIDAVIPGKAM